MPINNKGRMTNILEAIACELEDTLLQYASWQVDETGCRNPDETGKELVDKIFALRQLRQGAEDIIAQVDAGACRPHLPTRICLHFQ